MPRSSHNIISCRTPVCACAPVPRASWDTLVGLLLQWGCARSLHLCKDAGCSADFTNGQTTDCCERIYDKFMGPLVFTNRFSKYPNLESFYLDNCFPDAAPTGFQAGRLRLCWPISTASCAYMNWLCLFLFVLPQPNQHYPRCCGKKGLW